MAKFDVLIQGGTVVDGTRVPRFKADVGVKDGRVAQIGGPMTPADADQVLDAEGLIVAPGFVDLHTHYDAQIQWDPYCTISGWHASPPLCSATAASASRPCGPKNATAPCSPCPAPRPSRSTR